MTDQEFDSKIKDIFSDASMDVGDVNWNKFQTQLNKRLFYSFSWNRFNIYYLGALSVTVGAAALWFALNMFSSDNTVQPTTPTSTNQEQKMNPDANPNASSIVVEDKKVTNKKQPINTNSENIQTTSNTSNNAKDTVATNVLPPVQKTDTAQTVTTTPVVLKKKKTIVVAKRDTIIKTDTVRVKKK